MTRSYLSSTLNNRCPRCREGKLFQYPTNFAYKNNLDMNKDCPVCGQPTEIEVGFYYGTGYVSYALTVALTVSTLVAWWVLIGISTEDNRIFYWLIFNSIALLVLQPWMMRLSRVIYMRFFVMYDKDYDKNNPKEFE